MKWLKKYFQPKVNNISMNPYCHIRIYLSSNGRIRWQIQNSTTGQTLTIKAGRGLKTPEEYEALRQSLKLYFPNHRVKVEHAVEAWLNDQVS